MLKANRLCETVRDIAKSLNDLVVVSRSSPRTIYATAETEYRIIP